MMDYDDDDGDGDDDRGHDMITTTYLDTVVW